MSFQNSSTSHMNRTKEDAQDALKIGENPKQDNDTLRNFSRSPQPYHQHGPALYKAGKLPSLSDSTNTNWKSRSSRGSSESGTEADDERGGAFLRTLPAPPLRARKGLRGATPPERTPAVSPLPTPPATTGNDGRSYFRRRSEGPEKQSTSASDHERKLKAYKQRKREEIIRRATEVILLFTVASITASQKVVGKTLQLWRTEIWTQVILTAALYAIYPLRLALTVFRSGRDASSAFGIGIRVPSRFDPGPYIYPVFLPAMVAASLLLRSSTFLLPNLMLGLASLPVKVVPRLSNGSTIDKLHWLISVAPLAISQNASGAREDALPYAIKAKSNATVFTAEDLVLLYPLQCCTTRAITFLASTSLDPAETQLLSTALVNVLLFAATPQSQILKALILLGGIGLFITCQQLLSWEVALARVPSWRFARTAPRHRSIALKLDTTLCSKLVTSKMKDFRSASSDSDGNDYDENVRRNLGTMAPPALRETKSRTTSQRIAPYSAVERTTNGDLWPSAISSREIPNHASRRRNTLTGIGTPSPDQRRATAAGRPRRALTPTSSTFLTLTSAQAQVRKWLYALTVYAIVAAIVLVPIRTYIEFNALAGHEPFGWALGYLFGNISQFRYWTVSNNFDSWISLPKRPGCSDDGIALGIAEDLRQCTIGAANTRLLICGYCVVVLLVGIGAVLRLTSVVEVDTRRKVFHGIMVAMLLPTVFIDPCFIALALVLILAIFLLLDLFRASQLPPVSKPLTMFLAPYVDGRDHRGPVIVSHIFLLIGCAIPLWLSMAGAPRNGEDPWAGWETPVRDISMVSGVICVGMGDAAASLIGRRYGKHKWLWSGGKSLEGSIAFAIAVSIGLMASYIWMILGGWAEHGSKSWLMVLFKAVTAATGASLTEAVLTACNDNVVVPVVLWLLVRGLDI